MTCYESDLDEPDYYCGRYPTKPKKSERIKILKNLRWRTYKHIKRDAYYLVGFGENNEVKHFFASVDTPNNYREWYSGFNQITLIDDDIRGQTCFLRELGERYWDHFLIKFWQEDDDFITPNLILNSLLPQVIDLGEVRFRHLPSKIRKNKRAYYDSMIKDQPVKKIINDYFADKV